MKSLLPASAALLLLLTACKPADAPQHSADNPSPTAPPATSQPATSAQPEQGQHPQLPAGLATFAGYDSLKLGSTAAEVKQAWGAEFNISTPAGTGACYQLTPKWATDKADVAFMIEGDHFVRYDVNSSKEIAPGGGRVGMSEQELRALYGAKLQSQPHKYVEGGKYLSVSDQGGAKLVFETGADGKVTSWRVGLPPQIDYLEGCT